MLVSSIGSVGVPQFQGLRVAKPGPTAAKPSPDSAMWGNSVAAGSLNVMA